jgi:hypothetical protein
MCLAQSLSNVNEQVVIRSARKVSNPNWAGIEAITSRARGYHGKATLHAGSYEKRLVGDPIDTVDHRIDSRREDLVKGRSREEFYDAGDTTLWIDERNTLGKDIDLRRSDRSRNRLDLAIHIGDTHFIQVD